MASLDLHAAAIDGGVAACEALFSSIARYRAAYEVSLHAAAVDLRQAGSQVLRYADSDDPDVKMAIGSLMSLFESLHAACQTLTNAYDEVARVTEKDASYHMPPRTAFTAAGRARNRARIDAGRRPS